ncbi:MAG: ATP-binding protein [Planctomycetota bacterium]
MIVGPHGTGKSTLLHTFLPKLQQTFPKVAFHQLTSDRSLGLFGRMKYRREVSGRVRRDLYELPENGLVVIDGWEQLSRIARWRISQSAFGRNLTLLVTSHQRFSGWSVLYETKASVELVRALAGDLLSDSPHRVRKLIEEKLKTKRLLPHANIRELWFEFYDVVQDHHDQARNDRTETFH